MDKILIQSIIEHTKLYKTSNIPIEISQIAFREVGLSSQQLRQINDDIRQMVGAFINSNAKYDEAQLEIIFHMQLKDEIESYTSNLANKYECNPQGILNFTVWAVYKELAKLMFNRGYILRGIDCYTLQKQAEIVAEATGGRSFAEIKDIGVRDPKRIGNNEQIAELKKIGLSFAKEVLNKDKNKILSYKNLRQLTLDYLRFKHKNSNVILEILPNKSDSLKDWFRKDDYTYPIYLSKPGAVSDDVIKARNELINQTKLEYFK